MPDPDSAQKNDVVVVYALTDQQYLISVEHETGMTASDAVRLSGLPQRFPEIADRPLVLGLFGQPIDLDHQVEPGARIEICRPLRRDPRELRRIMTSQGMVVGQRESGEP